MKIGKKTKVLVVRPDRIGDVVLSTPVLEALKHYYPESEVSMLVRDAVFPVVQYSPFLSQVIVYRSDSVHKGFSGFWRLVKEIRDQKYDVAVTLQVSFFVSAAIFVASIPYRVGPYSKWYSYLFFNRGMLQKRSRVEMHEADYNLMLLRKLGIRVPTRRFEPNITVDADAKERMRAYIKSLGLAADTKFVVVHPGMGGSALNWPEGYYVDLVERLAAKNIAILVTGSVSEKHLVDRVIAHAIEHYPELSIFSFIGVHSQTGLSDFIALLSLAQVVVAPSTGPLHIAAALGKRTVSFYAPIKVQSALRWGPYAVDETRHPVLVPDALCGQDFKCAGKKCHFYFCMERLSVEEAVRNVLTQLENQ